MHMAVYAAVLTASAVQAGIFRPVGDRAPTAPGVGMAQAQLQASDVVDTRSGIAATVDAVTHTPDRNQREIFVAGCGHSGTTVMLRLIGQHNDIYPVRIKRIV